MNIFEDDIKRLNFEDILFVIFIFLISCNIYANQKQKDYVINNNNKSECDANNIYLFVLIVTLLLYFYFFFRNYNAYKKASKKNKKLFIVKTIGSSFLIAGAICLIYFQINDPNFVGAPSI